MKKLFLFATLMLAACGGNKTGQSAATEGTDADNPSTPTVQVDEDAIEYLELFYDSISDIAYDEVEDIVRQNITPRAKLMLNEAFDYDCESGDCIPVWLFFDEGGIDVDPTHLVGLEQTAEGTFRVTMETYPDQDATIYRFQLTIGLVKDGDSYKIDSIGDWQGKDVDTGEVLETRLPKTAERMDTCEGYELYVNEDRPWGDEGFIPAIYSVWILDRSTQTARRLLVTNTQAEAQWERMAGEEPNAVSVPMSQIAGAEEAWIVEDDGSKIVVQGCPDARNEWTYLIDVPSHTAKQLPGASGFQECDRSAHTITVATYGYYDEGGRYEYNRIFTTDGKFVERTEPYEI